MIHTAIYARKSTEQHGVADEQKSVARQIDHARQYAKRKGWSVAEEHVYIDDGISGAEFANRPGFLRMMNSLKPRASFDVLIMSEESRLGREAIETAYALKQLVQARVRVFFYLEDRERTLDSPTDKIMLSLTAFADELEREKARQRTYDAMQRKARNRHVTGGRVFGYDNIDVLDANGTRSHVERRINAEEAAIVCRIFKLCAQGKGLRSIAHQLNDEHAPSPRAQQGRPKAWAPTSIRAILHRPLYRGQIVWAKTRKRDLWGQTKQHRRPESEWISVDAPELRIVPDRLWNDAHERLEGVRATYLRGTDGQLWGRPISGLESKYLLSGLGRCGVCGGSMIVRSRSHGKKRMSFLACSSYHFRGTSVCANSMEMRLEDADNAVLRALERELLDPEIIEKAMRRALDAARPEQSIESRRSALSKTIDQVTVELDRLTAAIVGGGDASTIVQAIRDRERRLDALKRELADLAKLKVASIERGQQQQILRSKLTEWRGLLREHAPRARQMLRKLIEGRIVFTPDQKGVRYSFTFKGTMANVFNGLVDPFAVASPTGFEPVFWP
jgi:site-specific DNA recombinase